MTNTERDLADLDSYLGSANKPLSISGSPQAMFPKEYIFYTGEGAGDDAVLKLTSEGFIYKGEVIEDAGEAYKIFMEVMHAMKASRGLV